MAESTNNIPPARDERPERPEWANRVIDGLYGALACGGGDGDRLTPAERDLIDAVCLRVRHRLGETGSTGIGLDTLAEFVFDRGAKTIAAERS